ncbi:hypothetical protein BV898_14607 [Hypsibius exemplaris]|uniref:Uncharacterized protein n=1 Tax=Hypsibius exemplaris TaxID=2072580 RepID=A0A9X6NG68_HYPEX|nr:hypothetical protein BV898_14607 [Hypsibius exemplaris]
MFAKLVICLALVGTCLCQLIPNNASAQGQQQSSSTSLVGTVTPTSAAAANGNQTGNASSAAAANQLINQAPVTQFFSQVLRGEVFGLRKCKKPKDCGLGLRCDSLLNLCVPLTTPILGDIEKPCSNDSECSGMHACQGGLCRFCGPKSCRSNLDCCAGSFAQPGKAGSFYECLNVEDQDKLSIARQLGRVPANFQPLPKAQGGQSLDDIVDSNELIQLGLPAQDNAFHGKRCWARCNVDTDCYHEKTPADVKQSLGCCNNVCTRKSACTVLSPAVIQQAQLLQQQRLQQQQAWNQQQALVQQQQHLQGQVHHQSQWGTGGHQQNVVPQQRPQSQQVQFQFAVPVAQAVVVPPPQPAPQSWQQAQQQQPSQAAINWG